MPLDHSCNQAIIMWTLLSCCRMKSVLSKKVEKRFVLKEIKGLFKCWIVYCEWFSSIEYLSKRSTQIIIKQTWIEKSGRVIKTHIICCLRYSYTIPKITEFFLQFYENEDIAANPQNHNCNNSSNVLEQFCEFKYHLRMRHPNFPS